MRTCRQAWEHMTQISAARPVRNFTQVLDMADYLVETELFPVPVLDAYSSWNLEHELTPGQRTYFSEERGGGQGDYRQGMASKVDNVVDCLNRFPNSKRAVITIPNQSQPSHTSDDEAKCMREIHFHLHDGVLHASVFFRAQAASIFPKNIHFIGSLMETVAGRLKSTPSVGTLHYFTTILVGDRS